MDSTWTKEQVLGAVYASFQALGLEPTRDRAAIKKAFRREASLWHPDKHPPERKPDCEARFNSLVNARDMCLEASEIELLMRDLESWDPKRQGVGGRGPTSAPRAPRPAPHPDRATGAPPRPSSSGRHTADSEWQVFVDQPSAYFDLFSSSAAAFLVTGLVALLSMAITVTVIFVAIVVSLVVMIVSLILSALAISIPVIGWIGLAMAGFYLLEGILEVG